MPPFGTRILCAINLGSDIDNYPKGEKESLDKKLRNRIKVVNGISVEQFRYYKGIPDGMGRKPRD